MKINQLIVKLSADPSHNLRYMEKAATHKGEAIFLYQDMNQRAKRVLLDLPSSRRGLTIESIVSTVQRLECAHTLPDWSRE